MKRLQGILILLTVIFLFFLPSILLQKNSANLFDGYKRAILVQSPQQENLPLIYSPFRKFDFEQLHNRHFPFWNPYIFGGAPFFADDQSAVLSVYTLVGSLFPYNESFLVVSILKLIITGIGMFLLLSLFSLNIYACLLGSITWMFSAFMMTFHIHHTAADAGSFIPWFFYFFERLIRNLENQKSISLVLGGFIVSVGLSLFAGHAETTIVGSAGISIYALTKAFMSKKPMRIIFYTFIGLLLGFLLASVQLVPFLAIILQSEPYYLRSHAIQVLRSMPIWTVIMWFAPSFYFLREGGTQMLHQSTTYIGITSLILAVFSIFEIKRYYRSSLPFLMAAIVTIGIGYVIPPFSWLLKIPIIRLGGAFRFLAITEFSLAVLAGFGMDMIQRNYSSKDSKSPLPPFRKGGGTQAGLGSGGFEVSLPPFSKGLRALTAISMAMLTLFAVALLVTVKFNILRFLSTLNYTVWIHHLTNSIGINIVHIIILAIFVLVILFIIFKTSSAASIAGICLLILSMGDLFTYGMFGMAYNPLLISQSLEPSSPIIKTLMQQSSPDYTFYTNSEILMPNSGMMYGLRDFRGFDIVVSRRYQKFLSVLFTDTVTQPDASGEYHNLPSAPDPVIASIAGIKYFITRGQGFKQYQTMEVISTYNNLSLWENPNAKPIIYLADAVKPVEDSEEALKILSGRSPELLDTSIVTGIDESGSFDNTKIKLTRIKDRAGEHIVDVDAGSKGFLVINEPYYPGWRAYIDGKAVSMYHVNYLFQGVKLPRGVYTVKIIYRLYMFYLGLIVSVLTALIIIGMIIRQIK
jgi:hypothetical protein